MIYDPEFPREEEEFNFIKSVPNKGYVVRTKMRGNSGINSGTYSGIYFLHYKFALEYTLGHPLEYTSKWALKMTPFGIQQFMSF